MEALFWYLIGWLIFSIGYFIYAIKEDKENKKLAIYHSLIYGVVSWLGILFIFVMCIVSGMFTLNEWIENKLS
jgi:hypothetical protein